MLAWRVKGFSRKLYWAARSRALLVLPGRAKRLVKALLNRNAHAAIEAYGIGGVSDAKRVLEALKQTRLQISAYRNLARLEMSKDVLSAAALARQSLQLDDSPKGKLWACMALWDAGCITEAHELMTSISAESVSPAAKEKMRQIEGAYRLQLRQPDIPEAAPEPRYTPVPSRILYVASSSQPYHVTGYTTRTHHLLQALQKEGWDVHCVTRPGYPFDRPDSRNINGEVQHTIADITYERLPGKNRREQPYDDYLLVSAHIIIEAAQRIRPSVIHAASNYESALPALIAARKLGIPYCYEVRGLWEYTAASKKQGWEKTERFALDRLMEAHTASHADHVFTLTGALANELQNRGVAEDRINLLPNAVDLSFFTPSPRDNHLADTLGIDEETFVIGYVGSTVKYEGLDDLVAAFAEVAETIGNTRLLVVGSGDELDNLRELASATNHSHKILFTGKVPHSEVARYFSLMNTIALPRKPYQVCELVSPLKPFEAMAMRVPLVVSDVAALKEIVIDGHTALVHRAGDSGSLASALKRLADKPLQQTLAANAFERVSRYSQWNQVLRPVSEFYEAVGAKRAKTAKKRIRVLSVGSLPPEWGGSTRGGVASIHQVILQEWLRKDRANGIELVGAIANNWAGSKIAQLPEGLQVFEAPNDKALERQWYSDLLVEKKIECVVFFHIANRWAFWHSQLEKRIPSVGAVHSWHTLTDAQDPELRVRKRDKIQKTIPGIQQLLFPSRHTAVEGLSLGLNYNVQAVVVPNSIADEFLEPYTPQERVQRILFVGSLIPRKRVDLLIRATEKLGMPLAIIGEGPERSALEQLAESLSVNDQIEFLGEKTPGEIAHELRTSSVLCVPSQSESFGIVYLEAIACGIPVVGFAPTLNEIQERLGIEVGRGVSPTASLEELVIAIQEATQLQLEPRQLRAAVKAHYSATSIAAGYAKAVRYATETGKGTQ